MEAKETPAARKKCRLNSDFNFTYEFSEKPKMGTVILKVQVFNAAGQKNTSFVITGRYDMPAMSGAHDSGDQTSLNFAAGAFFSVKRFYSQIKNVTPRTAAQNRLQQVRGACEKEGVPAEVYIGKEKKRMEEYLKTFISSGS